MVIPYSLKLSLLWERYEREKISKLFNFRIISQLKKDFISRLFRALLFSTLLYTDKAIQKNTKNLLL
ncbi:hypothetical protein BGP_0601 [Beggiatoa sp. PS]|nr:hypothetical protein BGP_0601 [Beggiatoa sp. PS]